MWQQNPVVLIFVLAPYVAAMLVVVFVTLGIVATVRAHRSSDDE